MIPEGLAGFPYQYRSTGDGDFEWAMGSSLNPSGMICLRYRGYNFLDGTELRVIAGEDIGILELGSRVSVEFIYMVGSGM